jgi:hypothetical protein
MRNGGVMLSQDIIAQEQLTAKPNPAASIDSTWVIVRSTDT